MLADEGFAIAEPIGEHDGFTFSCGGAGLEL
jgi:hypothetical protein